MMKSTVKWLLLAVSLAFFAACGGKEAGEKLELEVTARLDGKPVAQAQVSVDGKEIGTTDVNGLFAKTIQKKAGAEVLVMVNKEMPGYTIMPWKDSFVVKLGKEGAVEKYSFTADLKASQFFTVQALDQGAPVKDATVTVGGKEVGKTDANGEFIYEYPQPTKGGFLVTVGKEGFGVWEGNVKPEPGQKVEAALSKQALIKVACYTDDYVRAAPVAGVSVSLNGSYIGKTNAAGTLSYSHKGTPGKKGTITLSAPGYIPGTWEKSVTLSGQIDIQRYFYPATPKAIRTTIYGFGSNTPGADLKDALDNAEQALRGQLFKYGCFREVPAKTVQSEMKRAKLSVEKATTKGWQNTPLNRTVDMIVMGSVAKDDKGLLIETKFFSSSGKVILSQLSRARGPNDLSGVAKEIAATVIERFPFEGTVVAVEDDRYRINLGKASYRISKGMEFDIKTPKYDAAGKVTGHSDVASAKVRKVDDVSALLEAEDMKKGAKVSVGDRAVRFIPREEDEEGNFVIISTKGGVPPDVSPLGSVNIYLNNEWIAATAPDGKAHLPVRLGKNYNVVLYRHGYQQINEKLRVDKSGDTREFTLNVNNSIFNLESEPSGATVTLDGESLGKTPISNAKVTLGFHTVRISAGEDYRDWEEVVEFDKKVEDRTGSRKAILYKDYLAIAGKALQKGDVQGAVSAYAKTQKGHPDYSEAHHRLAQLYLDELNDYDGAIREFEDVMNLPENRQLVFKQFAIAYTNLGHAYYEKGNHLVNKDRDAAARYFGKAIQNLQTAKQNTRFFPNQQYDEALHDTYYYLALSYHKLYLLTKKSNVLNSANLAWREYFDFFPKSLEGNKSFEENRDTAQKYWDQIKGSE